MFVSITTELISEVTRLSPKDFSSLQSLDLHLKQEDTSTPAPKIRKIEKLTFFPNLKQLNLSYNAIVKIENLEKLTNLVELNLAENAIQKIENLDSLVMLERLNLSGNQIGRIPPSMMNLKRLSHLRLARNVLRVLEDIKNLTGLDKLTNLRLDDNPLTSSRDYDLFTVFHIPSLVYLDGVEVSEKKRETARGKFASDHMQSLKHQIASGKNRLDRLRKEIQEYVGSGDEIPQNVLESKSLGIKLNEVKAAEHQLEQLQLRLQELTLQEQRGVSLPYSTSNDSVDEDNDSSIIGSRLASPFTPNMKSPNRFTALSPPQLEFAKGTIVQYNEKVEKLASRVLSVEKEKEDLQQQLNQRKLSQNSVEMMRRDFLDMEEDLKEALQLAQSATEEARILREELAAVKKEMLRKEAEIVLQKENMEKYMLEIEQLKAENANHVQLIEDLRHGASKHSAIDDHRSQELRITNISKKLEYEQLQRQNDALKVEIDKCRAMASSLNEDMVERMEELNVTREKLRDKEKALHEKESKLFTQERENRKLHNTVNDLNSQQSVLEQENKSLLSKMVALESELAAMHKEKKARSSQEAFIALRPVNNSPIKSPSRYYFDVDSVDSDDGKSQELGTKVFTVPLPKFEPSSMDKRAAEIIGYILFQEVSSLRNDPVMKDGCLRAAFRLIYAASQLYIDKSSGENVKIPLTPFHALSDKITLGKLIADAQSGLVLLEDVQLAKEEITQLKKVEQELESKLQGFERTYNEKMSVLKTLEQHSAEAKMHVETSLGELENIQKKLQSSRDEFVKVNGENDLVQRELELAKFNLKECIALGHLESKNVTQLRDRVSQLKLEHEQLESNLLQTKEIQMKEEQKLRSIKATISEEIRLMQQDVHKLQSEFKTKRMHAEEEQKHRRIQEEEWEIRKKEVENFLNLKGREHDEEAKKLTILRNELRSIKLETETVLARKKQLDYEVQQIQEKLQLEANRFETEDRDVRKRLQSAEKKMNEYEKMSKTLKEKRMLLESECSLVEQSLNELKRTYEDAEKSIAQKKKASEDEYSQVQYQIQVASRNHRQILGQIEQRQHEFDLIQAETRALQRKHDDTKRLCQETEARHEQLQRGIQNLKQESDRLTVTVAQHRREEDDLKLKTMQLKAFHDQEEKLVEEARRKIASFQSEGMQLQESEQKLKSTLTNLKQQLEEHKDELQQTRISIERERRELNEMVIKKSILDNDLNQLTNQLQGLQAKKHGEKVRHQEYDHQIMKSMEEMNRIAKQVSAYESKLDEMQRSEEEIKAAQAVTRSNYTKLMLEYDGLKDRYQQEKFLHSKLQDESTQLNSLIEDKKKDFDNITGQMQTVKLQIEEMKLQVQQLTAAKQQEEKELARCQEFNQLESKRLEKLETAQKDHEKQLQYLKKELEAASTSYEQTKILSAEESRKLEQQRQSWKATAEELRRLESSIDDARYQLETQKRTTIDEIGRLEQAKRSAQSHLIQINDTRSRIEATSPIIKEYPRTQPILRSYPASSTISQPIIVSQSAKMTKPTENGKKMNMQSAHTHSDDESSAASSVAPFELTSLSKAVENLRLQSAGVMSSVK